jgi:hypothetical protein
MRDPAMANLYWNYFLAVESDLADMARYVEFHPDNFKTYSVEFARILLAASSEVDVLCKRLCQLKSLPLRKENIQEYGEAIVGAYPDLPTVEVQVPRYMLTLKPWRSWRKLDPENGKPVSPGWWTGYNKVKHNRDTEFHRANLKNTLGAVAGLFVMVLFTLRFELKTTGFHPRPEILGLKPDPSFGSSKFFVLPGNP